MHWSEVLQRTERVGFLYEEEYLFSLGTTKYFQDERRLGPLNPRSGFRERPSTPEEKSAAFHEHLGVLVQRVRSALGEAFPAEAEQRIWSGEEP